MQGVVFRGNRKLEILDFDDPTPGPGDAIVEMKASGMCGSDLHFYRNNPAEVIKSLGFKDLASRGMSEDTPIIGGHEPCGRIVALGSAVDPRVFKVGDRVTVFHYEGCQHCDHCRSGWTQMCSHGADIHGLIKHGGHAQYMKVPVTSLVHLPDEVSYAAGAAISCGTGTAWGALLRLQLTARDTLDEKLTGLSSGADDYLTKPFAIQELEARLRALIRRERRQVGSEVLKVADLVLDPAARSASLKGVPVALTGREFDLLRMLLDAAGRVLTRRVLEEQLYAWGEAVGSNAVGGLGLHSCGCHGGSGDCHSSR